MYRPRSRKTSSSVWRAYPRVRLRGVLQPVDGGLPVKRGIKPPAQHNLILVEVDSLRPSRVPAEPIQKPPPERLPLRHGRRSGRRRAIWFLATGASRVGTIADARPPWLARKSDGSRARQLQAQLHAEMQRSMDVTSSSRACSWAVGRCSHSGTREVIGTTDNRFHGVPVIDLGRARFGSGGDCFE